MWHLNGNREAMNRGAEVVQKDIVTTIQGVSKKRQPPKKLHSQKSGSILPQTFWFISKKDISPKRRWASFGLVRHNYHNPQGLMNLVRFKKIQRMVSIECFYCKR